ncbi:MAG: sulfotransferase family 2 domain-containing protein [Verrucomicrobiota bacterium]
MLKQKIDKKPCLFNHIPKTAGVSLCEILQQTFSSRIWCVWLLEMHPPIWTQVQKALIDRVLDVDVVFGHLSYEGIKQFKAQGGNFQTAAFIRDPIRRLISQYLYGVSTHRFHEEFKKNFPTFLDFARSCIDGQTKFLIGNIASGEEAVALIKKEYDFIGITEMFDFSVFWFLQALGKNPVFSSPKSNVTPMDIPERQMITPEAIAEAEQIHQMDVYVYRELLKAFKESLRQQKDLAMMWRQSQSMVNPA